MLEPKTMKNEVEYLAALSSFSISSSMFFIPTFTPYENN
jgi:hypothetical protein